MDFFDILKEQNTKNRAPLAERMKPKVLGDFIGQEHIIDPSKLLYKLIEKDRLGSLIIYGPPGTGKTSLAMVIANMTKSEFVILNAVTSGVKDLREVVKNAEEFLTFQNKKTILFIDEIHRFNKSQQDALLPHVEKGTITLIGATTENPYFEVNHALLSRSNIFEMKKLESTDLKRLVLNAMKKDDQLLNMNLSISDEALEFLIKISDGDARRALNGLELASFYLDESGGEITVSLLEEALQRKYIQYDKSGDQHYDIISAFIKSMRGSDPDAAVHYLARMIKAGEDPKYIARRILVHASEDVGNADPMALVVANNAFQAVNTIGMPEARIILSQAAIYVASAPKSNASYVAINDALADIENEDLMAPPYYLKDSTTLKFKRKFENPKDEKGYLYPHAYEGNYVEQQYMPDNMTTRKYYKPTENGHEKKISEYLKSLKK